MPSVKHNKRRNSGLIFEFLVRHMASCAIDGDSDGYGRTVDIVRRHFAPGLPLAVERSLHGLIRSSRGLSSSVARKVLSEARLSASRLDEGQLDVDRRALIRELNYSFGRGFFSKYRVPEYRLIGAVQIALDSARAPGQISETVQLAQIEEGIVKYMSTTAHVLPAEAKREAIDPFVCAIATKKFNERYGSSFTRSQRDILETYMHASVSGDESDIRKLLLRERSSIIKTIAESRSLPEIVGDRQMRSKLDAAEKGLLTLDLSSRLDESVEEILLHMRLSEELRS